MTIREALRLGAQTLAQVPDPQIDAELLLGSATGMERLSLHLNAAQELTREQEQQYLHTLRLRAGREPLQYILGSHSFYGCELQVTDAVLIPRPETETLCEHALRCIAGIQTPAVADVCTGSGAIAIAIKVNHPGADVWATELAPEALRIARGNAKHSAAEIRFLEGDLLEPLPQQCFDLIVSNPPYIETAALDTLQPEVLREPRMALDGGADGLHFYRRLAAEAPQYLKHGGRLLLELGDGQADAANKLLTATLQFTDIHIHQDLFGKQRVLEAFHP